MKFRLGRVFACGLAGILLPSSIAGAAPATDIATPLMSAAECMERVLRATPGVTNVQINVSGENASAYPIIEYSSVDSSGRRRFTELKLFEIAGAQQPFIFDRADIADDPVAARILPVWQARCHAGYGFITSRPG